MSPAGHMPHTEPPAAASTTPGALRLALVSGGSRGLGRALCERLLAEGFQVVEFSRAAPYRYSVRSDLADPALARAIIAATLIRFDPSTLGELLVISNASTLQPIGPVERQRPTAIVANLNANLVAPVAWLGAVLAHFQASPARKVIAQITSGAARRPHAGLALYGAAKAGMEQFLRVLAHEQQERAQPFITVSVDPGALDTDMQAELRDAPAQDLPGRADFAQRQQLGQLMDAEAAAAEIVTLLCSPRLKTGMRYRVGPSGDTAPAPLDERLG